MSLSEFNERIKGLYERSYDLQKQIDELEDAAIQHKLNLSCQEVDKCP